MSDMQYMLPVVIGAFVVAHVIQGDLVEFLFAMLVVIGMGAICAGLAITAWWLAALIANKGDWTRIPR